MPMTWGEKEDGDRRRGDVSPAHRQLSQGAGGGPQGRGVLEMSSEQQG